MIRLSHRMPSWPRSGTLSGSLGWACISTLCSVLFASAAFAAGDAGPPAPPLTQWLRTAVDARGRGCTLYAQRETGTRVHVACGPAGLWEIDVSAGPVIVRVIDLGGEVVGFVDEPGGAWVKVQSLEARPLWQILQVAPPSVGALPAPFAPAPTPVLPVPTPPPAPTAAPLPPASVAVPSGTIELAPPTAEGRVLSVEGQDLIVSLGSDVGLLRGTRIALSAETHETFGDGQSTATRVPLAVGVVTSVSPTRSRVHLGMNERVPAGAFAQVTFAPTTRSVVAPPRATGVWEVRGSARPFVAIDELGGGVLFGASIGRRFEGHLHLEAVVDPLGVAGAEGRDGVATGAGYLVVSYDSDFFEIGIGAGAQTVNDTDFLTEPGTGLGVPQVMRIGAVDGLSFALKSSVVLFHSQFVFGSFVGTVQIPIGNEYWLSFGGGGGPVGYGYGEFGLRTLLAGNGRGGSTFLSASGGIAGLFTSGGCVQQQFGFECTDTRGFVGPMAGIGFEWRW